MGLLLVGYFLSSCNKMEVNPLVYENSSFEKITLYVREIVDDHTSIKDVTVSSSVLDGVDSVIVTVKTDTDITKLYGVATLMNGCTVSPVGDAPGFGEVGDFSIPHKYLVKSLNGMSREWTVKVNVAPPPPPVTEPTGFDLIRLNDENKYIGFQSQFGELQEFAPGRFGHSYDGTAEGFSKLVDDPDLSFINTEDFSLVFWVRTTANNSDPAMVATQNWASSGNTGFTAAFRGDNWRLAVSDGMGNKADASTSGLGKVFNDGAWHLLVVTFDRDGNMTMYQDGEEVASADMSSVGDIGSGNVIHIAQDGTGAYGTYFTGDIAGTQIYDHVLSLEDIQGML
jgi:hypothetical protein